jgi:hypothetical protein
MAKSSVATIIARTKRRIDYDVDDSDLDQLVNDAINDALKIIFQYFGGKFRKRIPLLLKFMNNF